MKKWLKTFWPNPERISTAEREAIKQEGRDLDARIKCLQGLNTVDPSIYLEAARRISDEEDRRKSGAETRATTFIAAVATLIPLMTWALGNTEPVCSKGWGCFYWTVAFILAVVYFVTAAYWALQSLAVANYHVIGVEDIVQFREAGKNIVKELIQQTLLQVRRNRDTINQKLAYIKVAQQRFFNGLAILGLLLMFDPISRLNVLTFVQSQVESWVSLIFSAPVKNLPTPQLLLLKPIQSPVPKLPSSS